MLKTGCRRALSSLRPLRPPIYDIIPQKKVINRILFDLDSRHNYNKLYRAYEIIYNKLGEPDEPAIPAYIDASDLMVMKKVLETIRLQTKTTNRHLVDLENELVEKAAEYGNNDAIALLCYEALASDTASQDDKDHAQKLVKSLLDIKHPLTIKLSGDLCFKNQMNAKAEQFYLQFLAIEDDTFLASEVYKSLGFINFKKPDLVQSKLYFQQSVKTGPIDKISESHYYLGQLNSEDPELSRYHFEMSATQGLKESFQQLGFLELNYFNNLVKAKEWFKLGYEVFDVSCMIGLFDCYIREQDWKSATRMFQILEKNLVNNEEQEKILNHFMESRSASIALMRENYSEKSKQEVLQQDVQSTDANKWGI